MAFKKKELVKLSLEAINKYKLVFISELCAFLPCSRATFYNLKLDKVDNIKEAMDNNKVTLKAGIRKKWYDSDNPTVQIALYRLLSTPEEHSLLSTERNKYGEGESTANLTEIAKAIRDADDT